jgi:hypothetical protein
MPNRKRSRWISKVKTESTHPPAGLFTKSAETIARTLASKRVSPKGTASGMRMLTYFINRAGHGLSAGRQAELNRAKALLSKRIKQATNRKAAQKRAVTPSKVQGEIDIASIPFAQHWRSNLSDSQAGCESYSQKDRACH